MINEGIMNEELVSKFILSKKDSSNKKQKVLNRSVIEDQNHSSLLKSTKRSSYQEVDPYKNSNAIINLFQSP